MRNLTPGGVNGNNPICYLRGNDGRIVRTVFLTGATGFVGGVLGRHLLSSGHRVKAALRGSSNADRVPVGCEVVRVDFLDPGSMAPHLEGVDVIQHVAGAVKARCQEEFDLANAASTAALVKAANTACVCPPCAFSHGSQSGSLPLSIQR